MIDALVAKQGGPQVKRNRRRSATPAPTNHGGGVGY